MKDHAKLSASGSHRWILCPGSVKAEENIPDIKSKYAEEGDLAHQLAERLFFKKDYKDLNVSDEMVEHVSEYVSYLNNISSDNETKIYIEKKVDFSHIVPDGFGTADALILKEGYCGGELHVIDLKYGFGNKVESYENTQLLLYAIGTLNSLIFKEICEIEWIHLEIYQPRLKHISKWTISISELRYWEGYIKAKAEATLDVNAPRIPSEKACKWCKASSTCLAPFKFMSELPVNKNSNELTTEETKHILDNTEMLTNFFKDVEERVYNTLLIGGSTEGYKLVKGKKIRKLKVDSEKKIVEILGEKAYNKSLVGVKDLEKLLDENVLSSLIYYSENKPLLVKNSDKREALVFEKFNAV